MSSKENTHNSSETQEKCVVRRFWATYTVNAESRVTEKLDLMKPQQETRPGEGYRGSRSLRLSPGGTLSSESASPPRSGQDIKGLLWEDWRQVSPSLPLAIAAEMPHSEIPKTFFLTKWKGCLVCAPNGDLGSIRASQPFLTSPGDSDERHTCSLVPT